MLELSSKQITFAFKDNAILIATLNIRNALADSNVSYKIKTTTPQNFDVIPSKGVLQPGESKEIQFKTTRLFTRFESETMATRQKFLIQSIPIQNHNKSQQIEQLWQTYKNQSSRIENVRLKVKIVGVELDTAARNSDLYRNSEIKVTAATKATVSGFNSDINLKDVPFINEQLNKYQHLIPQQKRYEKQEQMNIQFIQKQKANNKPKSALSKICAFLLIFIAGILFSRFAFGFKNNGPSRIIITHSPENISYKPGPVITKPTTDKKTKVNKLKGEGPQRIIVTSQDNSKVVLDNDHPDQPIRLTVKTAHNEDGTQKVIIS